MPEKKYRHIAKNADTELVAIDNYDGVKAIVHDLQQLTNKARIALQLAERWALVACEIDGESSDGRQKLRRMTSEELANHACAAVDALYQQFDNRGWIIPLPTYGEIVADIKDAPKQERRIETEPEK